MNIIGGIDSMKNKQSGQALVEFVLIIPVLIFLIFSFIDLGRIILENNRLENLTTTVLSKYEETQEPSEIKEYIASLGYDTVRLSISKDDSRLTLKLTKKLNIITPGLDKIIGSPYEIEVERVVNYEE